MISVRHRANSGRMDACWEFDSERRCIDLVLQQGNATITATVPVCSPDRPRHGAYPITRLDACTWHVIPARFSLDPTGIDSETRIMTTPTREEQDDLETLLPCPGPCRHYTSCKGSYSVSLRHREAWQAAHPVSVAPTDPQSDGDEEIVPE